MKRLLAAVKGILPYLHEDGMEGKSDYELAVIELEKAYREAAEQAAAPDAAVRHDLHGPDCLCSVCTSPSRTYEPPRR